MKIIFATAFALCLSALPTLAQTPPAMPDSMAAKPMAGAMKDDMKKDAMKPGMMKPDAMKMGAMKPVKPMTKKTGAMAGDGMKKDMPATH